MAVTHLNIHNKDFSGIILSGKELKKFKKNIKKLNKSLKNIRKIEL